MIYFAAQPLCGDKPSFVYAARSDHLGNSQVAAAVLLWGTLLTPQRRRSFFYGEVAACHPAAAVVTGAQSVITPPAVAEVVIPAAIFPQEVCTL